MTALSNVEDVDALPEVEQLTLWGWSWGWSKTSFVPILGVPILLRCYGEFLDAHQQHRNEYQTLCFYGVIALAVLFPLWYKMRKTSLLFAVLLLGSWALDKYSNAGRGIVNPVSVGVFALGFVFISHMIACATVYPLFAVIWRA